MFPLVILENLDEFLRDWQRAIGDGIVRGIQRGVAMGVREGVAEALATKHWKDRTGDTRAATSWALDGQDSLGASGWLECLVPHASYLEEGTEAHDIWPKAGHGTPPRQLKRGQSTRELTDIGTHRVALRWYVGGEPVFARMVHHPGTEADPFMARGTAKCERVIHREVELGIQAAQHILDS